MTLNPLSPIKEPLCLLSDSLFTLDNQVSSEGFGTDKGLSVPRVTHMANWYTLNRVPLVEVVGNGKLKLCSLV